MPRSLTCVPARPESRPAFLRRPSLRLSAALAALFLAACGGGGGSAGDGTTVAPPGGIAGLSGSWRQGACGPVQGNRSEQQMMVFTPSPTDRERADITLEWWVFASSDCKGNVQRLPAGALGSVAVKRTQSSGGTTSTWATWTVGGGQVWSAVWHWRGSTLCSRNGVPGLADDPERALPTARDVADFFSRIPENSPSCYARL